MYIRKQNGKLRNGCTGNEKSNEKYFTIFMCYDFCNIIACTFAETESASAATTTMVNEKVRGKVLYSYSYKVLTLINKERKKRKLSQLKMTRGLIGVANRRTAEISLYYAHSRPNGAKTHLKCTSGNTMLVKI